MIWGILDLIVQIGEGIPPEWHTPMLIEHNRFFPEEGEGSWVRNRIFGDPGGSDQKRALSTPSDESVLTPKRTCLEQTLVRGQDTQNPEYSDFDWENWSMGVDEALCNLHNWFGQMSEQFPDPSFVSNVVSTEVQNQVGHFLASLEKNFLS